MGQKIKMKNIISEQMAVTLVIIGVVYIALSLLIKGGVIR